jgi:hypothetical protein
MSDRKRSGVWLNAITALRDEGHITLAAELDAAFAAAEAREAKLRDVATAARAVLNGGFEREDTERADAFFDCLEDALTALGDAS